MSEVYLVDGIRTPIGRYGGALSSVRADDLGAVPIAALLARSWSRPQSTMCTWAAPTRPAKTIAMSRG